MENEEASYVAFFEKATGFKPYHYQISLALKDFPDAINIPTGLGKTAAVILAWIWKSENHVQVPRRLVYCLPMRSIVDQVYNNAVSWLKNLDLLASKDEDGHEPDFSNREKYQVIVEMGGTTNKSWYLYPENKMIIIGTQDMLISAALNRGYGTNKFSWPMKFGLLSNDSLWIADEVQLMENGVYTLSMIRQYWKKFGTFGNQKLILMSATMDEYLKRLGNIMKLTSSDSDIPQGIINASKTIHSLENPEYNDVKNIAETIVSFHREKTIAIFNTVSRAVSVYREVKKIVKDKKMDVAVEVIHSHYRPEDKKNKISKIIKMERNSIIISTQVLEAGVDISSDVLFTDIAPMSSLVQRFGRCNRYGEYKDADIYVFSGGESKKKGKEETNPFDYLYDGNEIKIAMEYVKNSEGKKFNVADLPYSEAIHKRLISEQELKELFDTSPDISGQDTDISPYVRGSRENHVYIFWRDLDDRNLQAQEDPAQSELCPVNVSDVRGIIKNKTKDKRLKFYRHNYLDGTWAPVQYQDLLAGDVLMVDSKEGLYSPEVGFDPDSKEKVQVLQTSEKTDSSYSSDSYSELSYKTIEDHTREVVEEVQKIIKNVPVSDEVRSIVIEACRWHDAGKAHEVFQSKFEKPDNELYAKAPKNKWNGHGTRKYFRHELVSGLLALSNLRNVKDEEREAIAYLAASHHGKVRVSIFSFDGEDRPDDGRPFADGVWDGDVVPSFRLPETGDIPETKIDLSLMQIGKDNAKSWTEMVLDLIDRYGIFKLAYMESIVRAADRRASGAS